MSRQFAQKMPLVLDFENSSLDANASTSGSRFCRGYAQLIGGIYVDEATETASGLQVEFSFDGGTNWDLTTASDAIGASSTTSCATNIVGDAVRVTLRNGGIAACQIRSKFMLKPV